MKHAKRSSRSVTSPRADLSFTTARITGDPGREGEPVLLVLVCPEGTDMEIAHCAMPAEEVEAVRDSLTAWLATRGAPPSHLRAELAAIDGVSFPPDPEAS